MVKIWLVWSFRATLGRVVRMVDERGEVMANRGGSVEKLGLERGRDAGNND